jgi:butyrate response factor 1
MSTLNENWLNVSGSSVWPTTFTPTSKPTKTDVQKPAAISSSFQPWSTSWEPSPSSQPLTKKSTTSVPTPTPTPKQKESSVTQQQRDQIESLVKPFQNFNFIDKNASPDDAWSSQIPTELDPKKQKKQQEKVIIEEELSKQNLYKTELCRSFQDTGLCRYGHKCQFAHGEHELRPVLRHPKYKTEVCKTFSNTGNCPYGARCRFLHAPPTADTAHVPVGPSPPPVETKPIAIKVPMHTPVVITVGNVPAVITPSPTAFHAKLVDPNNDDTDSDEDSASKKSRLAFFQNLTPENQ